jgi:hypothetical protein
MRCLRTANLGTDDEDEGCQEAGGLSPHRGEVILWRKSLVALGTVFNVI